MVHLSLPISSGSGTKWVGSWANRGVCLARGSLVCGYLHVKLLNSEHVQGGRRHKYLLGLAQPLFPHYQQPRGVTVLRSHRPRVY